MGRVRGESQCLKRRLGIAKVIGTAMKTSRIGSNEEVYD
jgi:hypothetical protein